MRYGRFRVAIVAGMMLALAPALAEAQSCGIDGAVYRPVSRDMTENAGEYVAEFRAVAGPVISNEAKFELIMREQKAKRTHTFRFFQPNGYGQTLISLLNPKKAMDGAGPDDKSEDEDGVLNASALFFDGKLATIDPLFDRSPPAPAYMLFADLGKAFWYSTLEDARSFVPPRSLWKRVRCKK